MLYSVKSQLWVDRAVYRRVIQVIAAPDHSQQGQCDRFIRKKAQQIASRQPEYPTAQ